MKITDIRAMRLTPSARQATTAPRRPSWAQTDEVANPMSRYPKVKPHRSLWLPPWEEVWCKVTLEDGTCGLGQTAHGRAVAAVIDDHLGPQLVGEDCLATEKLADMLSHAPYAQAAAREALGEAKGHLENLEEAATTYSSRSA